MCPATCPLRHPTPGGSTSSLQHALVTPEPAAPGSWFPTPVPTSPLWPGTDTHARGRAGSNPGARPRARALPGEPSTALTCRRLRPGGLPSGLPRALPAHGTCCRRRRGWEQLGRGGGGGIPHSRATSSPPQASPAFKGRRRPRITLEPPPASERLPCALAGCRKKGPPLCSGPFAGPRGRDHSRLFRRGWLTGKDVSEKTWQ